MATHRFTLIVEGPDLQAEPLIDELYEAGCDDALAGRSHGAFPPPVTDPRSRHRLWRWAEVDRWFETAVPGHQLDDREQVVTAINAALEFRRLRRCLPSEGRRALQELVGA